MTKQVRGAWIARMVVGTGILAGALQGCAAKESNSATTVAAAQTAVEDFCKGVVEATCSTLSGCCQGGTQFDTFECTRSTYDTCLTSIDAKGIHEGAAVFDTGAAQIVVTSQPQEPLDLGCFTSVGIDPRDHPTDPSLFVGCRVLVG
jgi:hypothetical protein